MKEKNILRKIAESAIIAAMYTALTLAIPTASYGLAQFRVAEALTILPVFTVSAIPGLAVGCMVSNIGGLAMGVNLAGAWDILFGSLATFAAAWMTYWLRNVKFKGLPVLATIPPVITNAVVVGLELALVLLGFTWMNFLTAFLYVGLGQLAACTICGLVLYTALERSGVRKVLFNNNY